MGPEDITITTAVFVALAWIAKYVVLPIRDAGIAWIRAMDVRGEKMDALYKEHLRGEVNRAEAAAVERTELIHTINSLAVMIQAQNDEANNARSHRNEIIGKLQDLSSKIESLGCRGQPNASP